MEKLLQHKAVLSTSRILLGLIFIVASVDKIAVPEIFAANIVAYDLVPVSLVNIVALILSWIELLCGVFLLGGYRVKSSAGVISVLLIIFIVAISISMARGLNIDCGCFGSAHATPVGWPKVIEDVGMLLLGIHLFVYSERAPLKAE